MSVNTEILEQALYYAKEFGWLVLPLHGIEPEIHDVVDFLLERLPRRDRRLRVDLERLQRADADDEQTWKIET